MKRADFPELAQLWQEQIDPAEQAGLETLATEIKRTARRRGWLDVLFTILGVGSLVFALIYLQRTTPPIQLGFALLGALMVAFLWRRRHIVKGANALATGEPDTFFAAAIANARAELGLARVGLAIFPPGCAFLLVLLSAASGVTGFDRIASLLFVEQPMVGALQMANFLFFEALGYRSYVKLRAQLRRLERMKREWEEEDGGDRTGTG